MAKAAGFVPKPADPPKPAAPAVELSLLRRQMIARAATIDEFETGFDGFEIALD